MTDDNLATCPVCGRVIGTYVASTGGMIPDHQNDGKRRLRPHGPRAQECKGSRMEAR